MLDSLSISSSKLKTYMECPALYYWRYVAKKPDSGKSVSIKLKPEGGVVRSTDENADIRVEQEPSAIFDSGKLVHRVLELAAKKRTSNASCDKKVTKKELLALLETAAAEPPADGWDRPVVISPATIESAAKVLALCWKKINFPFTIQAERKFNESIGPIEDDRGNVVIRDAKLSGVIDRIDRLPNGRVKIVDYKSGWSVMSRAEAEMDPQINFYLVVGKLLFPNDEISMELWYLNRGIRLGPIYYTEDRKDWLLNSYVKPILARMVTWTKYPETPGAPQCYSCPRKSECVSFASMIKGSLAPVAADMGMNLALWERLGDIEKNVEILKDQIKPFINSAVEKADDGEIFAGNHRARVIFRNSTAYHNTRDTAVAAAKAILEARKTQQAVPEIPSDPEALKTLCGKLVAENARLRSISLESATAFEVACKIAKTQAGLVNDFVDGLPEDVTAPVSTAIEQTSTNAGHYTLEVERIQLPFHDKAPTAAEIDEADRQSKRKKLPAGSKPILDDSHEQREPIQVEATVVEPAAEPKLEAPSRPALTADATPTKPADEQKPTREPVGETLDLFQSDAPKTAEAPAPTKAAWAQPGCVACGGTGISSSGGPCSPCVTNSARIGAMA